ncbi:MAG: DUF3575 domain-containing protein, partial [Bacteroidales bacterium]|nr:DUF3575 domain-containing protein [Bacteroidales bacterium]
MKLVNNIKALLVAIALVATAFSAYAQRPGSAGADENMLRYLYTQKQSRKVKFSEPKTFAERIYFFAGTGYEGLYQLGNHPESPGLAIGSRVGLGYWATPLHGVEMSVSYGMMPHGYWGENFLGNPVIKNTIIQNIGVEANYVLNITNHTLRQENTHRFDFFYTAGVNFGAGDQFHYGVNTSLKAIYNISTKAGLYLEPKVTLLNFEYIRPSITAGFVFRFKNNDMELEKPVDTDKKQPLFALKSNALFWLAGAPNFGIEYPINERWSICGDYVAPWSSSFATGLYYQLMMINAEGRYWFGKRDNKPVMTGFFAGASMGGGYYDFMLNNKKTGIQGEFYIMAGLSAGYSHSISSNNRVRLEYALGFGYMQTKFRKYHYDDFDYVLEAPKEQVWKTSTLGPTQA